MCSRWIVDQNSCKCYFLFVSLYLIYRLSYIALCEYAMVASHLHYSATLGTSQQQIKTYA